MFLLLLCFLVDFASAESAGVGTAPHLLLHGKRPAALQPTDLSIGGRPAWVASSVGGTVDGWLFYSVSSRSWTYAERLEDSKTLIFSFETRSPRRSSSSSSSYEEEGGELYPQDGLESGDFFGSGDGALLTWAKAPWFTRCLLSPGAITASDAYKRLGKQESIQQCLERAAEVDPAATAVDWNATSHFCTVHGGRVVESDSSKVRAVFCELRDDVKLRHVRSSIEGEREALNCGCGLLRIEECVQDVRIHASEAAGATLSRNGDCWAEFDMKPLTGVVIDVADSVTVDLGDLDETVFISSGASTVPTLIVEGSSNYFLPKSSEVPESGSYNASVWGGGSTWLIRDDLWWYFGDRGEGVLMKSDNRNSSELPVRLSPPDGDSGDIWGIVTLPKYPIMNSCAGSTFVLDFSEAETWNVSGEFMSLQDCALEGFNEGGRAFEWDSVTGACVAANRAHPTNQPYRSKKLSCQLAANYVEMQGKPISPQPPRLVNGYFLNFGDCLAKATREEPYSNFALFMPTVGECWAYFDTSGVGINYLEGDGEPWQGGWVPKADNQTSLECLACVTATSTVAAVTTAVVASGGCCVIIVYDADDGQYHRTNRCANINCGDCKRRKRPSRPRPKQLRELASRAL